MDAWALCKFEAWLEAIEKAAEISLTLKKQKVAVDSMHKGAEYA